ncbi:MAG TPA: amino acid adenylation domain-containing protein [Azospirillaceae bacterium]|nr:amino acid adenylation domain-containing protein [Azospirillaceae bacterium]
MLSRVNIQDICPLAPLQEGILFHDLMEHFGGDRAYFQQIVSRVRGPLDLDAFERSWNHLIARHTILRTVFKATGADRPVQIVLKKRELKVDTRDLTVLPPAERDAAVRAYVEADRQKPFALDRDVLMRVGCLRIGEREFRVIWSFHHILMDGWCIGILQDEMVRAYADLAADRLPAERPALPYSRFIRWLESKERGAALGFWSRYLHGIPDSPALPGQRPVAASAARRHRVHPVDFGPGLTASLRDLAARHRLTLNTIVQALWGVLLARLNDRRDAVFGAVVSIRPLEMPGIETMLGPCIATLPLRVRYDAGTTVLDLLRRLQDDGLDWLANAHAPLADIQERCRRGSLFNHFVAFENYPRDKRFGGSQEELAPGVVIDDVTPFMPNSYDFSVTVFPEGDLGIVFSFNEEAVDPAAVSDLGRRLLHLARQMAADPARPVDRLSLLDEAERALVLDRWSRGAAPAALAPTLPEARARVLAKAGDRPALRCGSAVLTHAELEARAEALAKRLAHAWSVKPGDSVALMASANERLVIAMLACFRLGAAFVPIDPSAPAARTTHILADCGAIGVLTDTDALFDADENGAASLPPVPADAPAYIIYTSGTTGLPKGVRVGARSLLNYVGWLGRDLGLCADDHALLVSSPAFDLGYTGLFGMLLLGGCLTLVDEDTRRDPQRVTDLIEQHRITLVKATPSYFHLLLAGTDGTWLASVPTFKTLILGGETQQVEDLRHLRRVRPDVRLVNHYGPTEATIGCVADMLDDAHLALPDPPQRIGRPIAGARVALVDAALEPVPPGVPGELVVTGEPLAQGYANAREEDAGRFVALPCLDGARAYRTGDYAQWLEDGAIVFLGRRDDQVKIRGYRVTLRAIESALRALPGVRDALVLPDAQPDGTVEAIAYVIAAADGADPGFLRTAMAGTVPDHMIPGRFVMLDAFPLTVNGKVDRAALAERSCAAQPSHPPDAPGSDLEEALREIWRAVLGRDAVALDDDFFELGGHSIKAILVTSRVRATLKRPLVVRDLFDHPTVRRLAAHLQRGRERSRAVTLKAGSGPAAVFLPATLGTSTLYKPLADALGAVHAIGLQCRGFDRDDPFDATIAAMAEGFAAEIRLLKLPSPVTLVGWSMGGCVALETARRLEAAGVPVRLVLIDARPRLPDDASLPASPLIDSFATLRDGHPYWRDVMASLETSLPAAELARLERLALTNQRALADFVFAGRLAADILCLEARDNVPPTGMACLTGVTTGRFSVESVPGDHFGLFAADPQAVVAREIDSFLQAIVTKDPVMARE